MIICLMYLLITQSLDAQQFRLDWRAPGTTNYSQQDIELCGPSRDLQLRASHVRNSDPNCPYPGWGVNRYRYTITILKNNVPVTTLQVPTSSCWLHQPFPVMSIEPGFYRARIVLETKRFPWGGWRVRFTAFTNSIEVTRSPSTPSFKINGITPDPQTPIEVCPSKIIIDPSDTACEDAYWIGVWEFDYDNWSRPGEYEWGKWFSGEAPSELNLQELSAVHSYGSSFLGDDPLRQGEILFGGKLSNNNDRYYHVSVCTGFPTWTCSSAIIKIKCNCN